MVASFLSVCELGASSGSDSGTRGRGAPPRIVSATPSIARRRTHLGAVGDRASLLRVMWLEESAMCRRRRAEHSLVVESVRVELGGSSPVRRLQSSLSTAVRQSSCGSRRTAMERHRATWLTSGGFRAGGGRVLAGETTLPASARVWTRSLVRHQGKQSHRWHRKAIAL